MKVSLTGTITFQQVNKIGRNFSAGGTMQINKVAKALLSPCRVEKRLD